MVNYQTQATINVSEQAFLDKIYWINQLSEELPETNFIADYTRPRLYSAKTENISFQLPHNLSEQIIKLANNSDLSIYLIVVTVLKILLQKYTGNHDIIIGSPVYHKYQHAGVSNKLVSLRTQVSNQLTCKDFLLQVKDTVIDAYTHQNYPVDEMSKILNLPESQNRCPIFDIVIFFKNIHNLDDAANIKNDLTVGWELIDNYLQGEITYNPLLFQAESIQLIVKSYIKLLANFVENIDQPISRISCLSLEDEYKILKQFNDNTHNFPVEKTLHQLFIEQVKRTPNKIAAVDDNTELTYQQLNERANQLARFIQDLGVQAGELIAILKQRDINFLIGILAILKAGGAYVPIDITYPPERIRYMLSNSEVRMLLTDSSCTNIFTGSWETCSQLKHLIYLQPKSNNVANDLAVDIPSDIKIHSPSEWEKLPTANLPINTPGIAPAYMIYTSGSTGLPKGAIIRHGGAINHIYAQFKALELSEDLTFVQSAPASSDISVWQFLAPILIGGKTVIVNTETVCSPEKLFQVIQQQNITIVELVPVIMTGLLDYISQLSPDERFLPNLKWMMVTGESASVELVNRWLEIYPQIKVINAYGPTEAADDITQFIIDKPLRPNQRTVSIGKPLANLNLYILDPQMQLLPIGALGEICVSGFGVGKGYWSNYVTTERSFIPNIFTDTAKPLPGTDTDFIYKTGDLGRWLPDGNIEFFGRIDHQVKIRGFRIELGEIEALLSQHPSVGENVVIAREDKPGEKRLVAYIVPHLETKITTTDLQSYLQEKVAGYMIPSAFVILDQLPLTPNGKVDRQALPQPSNLRPELAVSYVKPQTEIEKAIATIWQQALNLTEIGLHDSFFEIGGHSLLLIQVHSQLQKICDRTLTLMDMFRYPTISDLAEFLTSNHTQNQIFKDEQKTINNNQIRKNKEKELRQKMQKNRNI